MGTIMTTIGAYCMYLGSHLMIPKRRRGLVREALQQQQMNTSGTTTTGTTAAVSAVGRAEAGVGFWHPQAWRRSSYLLTNLVITMIMVCTHRTVQHRVYDIMMYVCVLLCAWDVPISCCVLILLILILVLSSPSTPLSSVLGNAN